MNAMPAGPGRSIETPRDTATAGPARHKRLRTAAAVRGVPLATILVTVAVVVLTYLAGKLAYRIRDVLLILMVAGFIALIMNPLVLALTRLGRGHPVRLGGAGLRRPPGGVRLPAGARPDPFLAPAARLRAERRARPG